MRFAGAKVVKKFIVYGFSLRVFYFLCLILQLQPRLPYSVDGMEPLRKLMDMVCSDLGTRKALKSICHL